MRHRTNIEDFLTLLPASWFVELSVPVLHILRGRDFIVIRKGVVHCVQVNTTSASASHTIELSWKALDRPLQPTGCGCTASVLGHMNAMSPLAYFCFLMISRFKKMPGITCSTRTIFSAKISFSNRTVSILKFCLSVHGDFGNKAIVCLPDGTFWAGVKVSEDLNLHWWNGWESSQMVQR